MFFLTPAIFSIAEGLYHFVGCRTAKQIRAGAAIQVRVRWFFLFRSITGTKASQSSAPKDSPKSLDYFEVESGLETP
jgi:hypothetical protein